MLRYEPIGEHHVPLVEPMLDDPDVLRFTGVPDPAPEGFAHEWLGRYVAARAEGTKEGFAAFFEDDGALAGLALAPVIDPEGREMELGYMVPAAARRRGAATAMLRWLTRWAFDERGALRVYLRIDAENPGSVRVAELCGYRYEGTLRSAHLKQGRRIDQTIWSRLPTDP